MKLHKLLSAFFIFFLVQISCPAQWTVLNTGTTAAIMDVSFPSINTGYFIDDSSNIFKTINAGTSWSKISKLPTGIKNDSIRTCYPTLRFLSIDTGFAAFNWKLFKTSNGGLNWTDVFTDSVIAVDRLSFPDSHTGYALTFPHFSIDTISIYKSVNSGNSWNRTTKIPVNNASGGFDLNFLNDNLGYLIIGGDSVYKTVNGGNLWTNISTDFSTGAFCFPTMDTAYRVLTSGGIEKSTNAGLTWNTLSSTNNIYIGTAVHFLQKDTGFVSCKTTNLDGGIIQTTDGGNTWNTVYENINTWTFYNMCFPSHRTGYACGEAGLLVKWNFATSISEYALTSNFSIFPNPSIGLVELKMETPNHGKYTVAIKDMLGNSLITVQSNQEEISLDLTSISKGAYFINLINENGGRSVRKLLLQ